MLFYKKFEIFLIYTKFFAYKSIIKTKRANKCYNTKSSNIVNKCYKPKSSNIVNKCYKVKNLDMANKVS